MKKLFISIIVLTSSLCASAGGLMTNTNYHIAFDRMFARGATTEIDAAYSNPAGLVWGHEGWQMSLNFQKPWQRRNVETQIDNFLGEPFDKEYIGKASAPIVPAFFASYHKDKWAVSTMIGIVGSGGFVEYEEGVPMFNVPITALLASKQIMPGSYTLDSQMKGKQYIYGGQVNFAYKFIDCLSASVGFRANYYDGYYKGHVVVTPGAQLSQVVGTDPLVNLQLDCIQRGWGFAPIIGVNYHKNALTVAMRYEFRTKLNTKNDTKTLSADVKGMTPQEVQTLLGDKFAGYLDGAETRYDMPSLFVAAVGYEFTPRLRGAVEYHYYDDKHAKMGGDRQKTLSHGTHEVLAGVEYDINKKFTVSLGGQRTDYGLTDEYQQNTSFACDSYSIGCGGAWNVNEKIRLNFSYFCSLYSDYNKSYTSTQSGGTGYYGTPYGAKETYSRTNHVIGVGIDYKF